MADSYEEALAYAREMPRDGCRAVIVAKVSKHHHDRRSILAPVCEMRDVPLRCTLHDGHDGPHSTTMPIEAGDDAGREFLWPNER